MCARRPGAKTDPEARVPHIPDEPPPWVTQRLLWRLANCVVADHRRVDGQCEACAVDWPCRCRTLAERALIEAQRRPRRRRVRNQAYLDWLREHARGGES